MTPSPWEFALLALAAYRLWRLVAVDDVTEPIRARIRPNWIHQLLECPWCLGAYIAVGWWALWWAWSDALVVAVPFAVSCAVGAVAFALDALSE